jgi:hypothetical protein
MTIDADAEEVTYESEMAEAAGWNRILCSYQGQEAGWKAAIAKLRELSGFAFADGKDDDAKALRRYADALDKDPALAEFRREAAEAYARQLTHESNAEGIIAGDAKLIRKRTQ